MSHSTAFHALARELRPVIEEAVEKKVAPLRKEVEALREALADRDGPEWLTPAQAGERIGRTADWVRTTGREILGVVRRGDGPKPRLDVPAERVSAYLEGGDQ